MGNVIEDIQVRDGRGGEEVVGGSLEEHVIFRRIEGGLVIVDKVYKGGEGGDCRNLTVNN